MSTPRYCEFWKASDGKWYLNLAVHEEVSDFDDEDDIPSSHNDYGNSTHGTYEDSITYGPFASENECEDYLSNFSNPGSFYTDESGKKPPPTKSPNGSPVQRVGSQRASAYRPNTPFFDTKPKAPDIASAQAAASRAKAAAPAGPPGKTAKVYGGKTMKGPAGSTRKVSVHTRLQGKAYGPNQTSRFKKGDTVSVRPSTYAGFAKDNKTPYQIAVNEPDESGKSQHWNVDKSDIGESVLRRFVTEVLKNKR